jgi:hypothetical protein
MEFMAPAMLGCRREERMNAGKEGRRAYSDLEAEPPSYRFEDSEAPGVMLDRLNQLGAAWAEHPEALSKRAPRPAPELRILPRI